MTARYEDHGNSDGPTRLSRSEIETLCILYAVGAGCSLADLAERLGLPRKLTSVVVEAMETLITNGYVVVEGAAAVTITATGRERLHARLDDLGIPHNLPTD